MGRWKSIKKKNKINLLTLFIFWIFLLSNLMLSESTNLSAFAEEDNSILLKNPIEKLSDKLKELYFHVIENNLEDDKKIEVIILFDYLRGKQNELKNFELYLKWNEIQFEIKEKYTIIDGILLKSYISDLKKIAIYPNIISIWENGKIELTQNIENYIKQANSGSSDSFCNFTEIIGATDLWDLGYNGSNIIISVLDTGVDITGQYDGDLGFPSEDHTTLKTKVVGSVSLVPEEPLYYSDFNGRGTFHAGIACGIGKYNSSYKGIAPGASYLNVKIYDSIGITYWSFIISGIEWSLAHGADILLFCASIPGFYDDPVSIAINNIVDKGIIVVTPAGDEGSSYLSLDTPGMALKSITVGAYNHSNQNAADFSSRGPSLDFRMCPDILAPGVNLIGPRSKIFSGSLENFSILGYTLDDFGYENFYIPEGTFPEPEYGTIINENYTMASGTGAAAAVVSGAIALLLEVFPLATPELLRYALVSTTIQVSNDKNTVGAGLINIYAAFNFLLDYFTAKQYNVLNLPAPLIYPGIIYSQDSMNLADSINRPSDLHAYDISALLSSQIMLPILMINNGSDYNFTTIHLLLNQFGLRYNNSRTNWFSEFIVIREMHQITLVPVGWEKYKRYLSILKVEDSELYIVAIVESWDYSAEYVEDTYVFKNYTNRINAFQFNLHFFNLGFSQINNLQLVSFFKVDLFLNETAGNMTNYMESNTASLDDICKYDVNDELIYIYDENNNTYYDYTSNFTAIGFNSTSHNLSSWEIGNSTNLIMDLTLEDTSYNLANDSTYEQYLEDPGFAMIWNISEYFEPNDQVNFTAILGTGIGIDNNSAYNAMIDQMRKISSNITIYNNVTDLIVLEVDFSRIGKLNERYESSVKIMNVGSTLVNSTEVIFAINKTNDYGVLEVFSVIFLIENLKPFDILEFNANWTPTSVGVYTCGWILGLELVISLIEPAMGLFASNIDSMLFNNYLVRNIYIIDYIQYQNWNLNSLFISPGKIDQIPFKIWFPGDLGIYNITIYSLTEIPDLFVTIDDFGKQFCDFILLNFSAGLSDLLTGFGNKDNNQTDPAFTVDMTFNKTLNYDLVDPYFCIPLFVMAPPISRPGEIAFNISFYSQNVKFYDLLINFTISDYRGRALFDVVHNNITLYMNGTDINFEWDERYDHPYGNFYGLRELWGNLSPKGAIIMTLMPGIEYELAALNLGSITEDMEGMENLLGSVLGAYYLENDFITTNYINHDILQLFDVLILNDPESAYSINETDDIIEWVENGGVLIFFIENEFENNITTINDLLSNFNLTTSGYNSGKKFISSNNRTNLYNLFDDIGTIKLQDPVNIENLNPNSENVDLLCDYIALATYGKGRVLAIGDKDMFGISGLESYDNSKFTQNIGKWAFDKFYDFNLSVRNNTVKTGDKIYLTASLLNYDEIKEYLDDDLFFISGYVYEDGTMINASLMGFEIPILPMFETQPGNFMVYFDTTWYDKTGDYYFVLLLDHPELAAETLTFKFTIISQDPEPPYEEYEYPNPRYSHIFDIIAICMIIGMTGLLWVYNFSKLKRRLSITPLEGKLLNQARTYINQANTLFKQMRLGIGMPDIKEIDKIRLLLSNRKRIGLLLDDLKKFGEDIGEHY